MVFRKISPTVGAVARERRACIRQLPLGVSRGDCVCARGWGFFVVLFCFAAVSDGIFGEPLPIPIVRLAHGGCAGDLRAEATDLGSRTSPPLRAMRAVARSAWWLERDRFCVGAWGCSCDGGLAGRAGGLSLIGGSRRVRWWLERGWLCVGARYHIAHTIRSVARPGLRRPAGGAGPGLRITRLRSKNRAGLVAV